jgi:hypothetical protein
MAVMEGAIMVEETGEMKVKQETIAVSIRYVHGDRTEEEHTD